MVIEKNSKFEFITGNRFIEISDWALLNPDEFIQINKKEGCADRPWSVFFVKTDYIGYFFKRYAAELDKKPFKIITHNSDFGIDEGDLPFLNHKNLIHWWAQNVKVAHPKLSSIPIGIANPEWPHGNETILKNAVKKAKSLKKNENGIYCNFSNWTNTDQRNRCEQRLAEISSFKSPLKPFDEYLDTLSRFMFCASPEGNGVDCHKAWECLYLGVSPIVTKSVNSSFYEKDYPIIVIDSWDDVAELNFKLNKNFYDNLWENFNPDLLNFKYYKQGVFKT